MDPCGTIFHKKYLTNDWTGEAFGSHQVKWHSVEGAQLRVFVRNNLFDGWKIQGWYLLVIEKGGQSDLTLPIPLTMTYEQVELVEEAREEMLQDLYV